MKKIWVLLVLGLLLSGCYTTGSSNYNAHYNRYANWSNKIHKQDSRYKYFVSVISKSTLKTFTAASAYSYEGAYQTGCDGLKKAGYYDCALLYKGNKQVYRIPTQRTYSSGSTSYGSSYASSQSLYYDPSSGGMRECAYDAVATGKCSSFKPYNRSLYNTNTLFYNPRTDTMRPCIGAVTATGRCTAYGIFNHTQVSKNKGQLFYDSRNQKMTTCRYATFSGGCSSFDIVPNSYARSAASSGWKMTPDPSNPSLKRVPRTSRQLIEVGLRMSNNQCTLGLNC